MLRRLIHTNDVDRTTKGPNVMESYWSSQIAHFMQGKHVNIERTKFLTISIYKISYLKMYEVPSN